MSIRWIYSVESMAYETGIATCGPAMVRLASSTVGAFSPPSSSTGVAQVTVSLRPVYMRTLGTVRSAIARRWSWRVR